MFVIPLENVVIPGVGLLSIVVGMIAAGICVLAIIERGSVRPLNAGPCAHGSIRALGDSQLPVEPRSRRHSCAGSCLSSPPPHGLAHLAALRPRQDNRFDCCRRMSLVQFVAGMDTIYQFIRQNEAAYQRYAGAGANPDDLGLMMALSVPIAYCFFIQSRAPDTVALRRHTWHWRERPYC